MSRICVFSFTAFALLLSANPVFAQAVDCDAIAKRDCRKDLSMEPKDIRQCIMRGYDAPITCRKDEGKSAGVRVSGSSGFSYGAVEAPQNSPGASGAQASLSAEDMRDDMGFGSWPGFPCTLPGGIDLCHLGSPPTPPVDPSDPCPAAHETSGIHGVKTPLVAGSVSLTCGGAIPLTTYQLTLNANPDHLATTEYGSFYIWLYQQSGAGTPYKLGSACGMQRQAPVLRTRPAEPGISFRRRSHVYPDRRAYRRVRFNYRGQPDLYAHQHHPAHRHHRTGAYA